MNFTRARESLVVRRFLISVICAIESCLCRGRTVGGVAKVFANARVVSRAFIASPERTGLPFSPRLPILVHLNRCPLHDAAFDVFLSSPLYADSGNACSRRAIDRAF